MKPLLILLLSFFAVHYSLNGQAVPPFEKGDRIAFLGNSITDGGHYHSYIWLYYMTRFPDRRIDIFNSGIGGDVIGMMYRRFDEDVMRHKPSTVVLTFGMNDSDYGIYLKPDADSVSAQRVKKSYEDYRKMEARLRDLPSVETVLMTSPPFDETAALKSAVYPGKDAAMQKINGFMKSSAEKNNWSFLDLRGPMTAINKRGQQKDSSFTLQGKDRIHPEQDGHMVMAYLFLKAQGLAGREVAEVKIDAELKKIDRQKFCSVSDLQVSNHYVRFDYLASALPYPMFEHVVSGGWGETRAQADALKVIPFTEEFNREMLFVDGLPAGMYELLIDEQPVGKWSSDQFASGLNLALEKTPQRRQAEAIMYLNEERWEIERKLRVYYWFQFDFLKDRSLLFADDQKSIEYLNSLRDENPFIKGLMPGYLKAMHPEVRDVWRKEMNLILDKIYTINKPVNRKVEIKKVT